MLESINRIARIFNPFRPICADGVKKEEMRLIEIGQLAVLETAVMIEKAAEKNKKAHDVLNELIKHGRHAA